MGQLLVIKTYLSQRKRDTQFITTDRETLETEPQNTKDPPDAGADVTESKFQREDH